MAGSTSLGFRYPEDTDPVSDGALAVRNLANDVNSKAGIFASGTATAHVAAAQNGDVVVNFPAGRFTAPPVVVATSHSSLYYALVFAGPSTSSVTLRAIHRDGSSATVDVPIHWIAVQQ